MAAKASVLVGPFIHLNDVAMHIDFQYLLENDRIWSFIKRKTFFSATINTGCLNITLAASM